MSIDPTVRPAHIVDMPVVLDLDAQYRNLLLDQRGGIAWLAEHVPLVTLPPQDVVESSFVGEIDGAVIGFLRGTIDLIPARGMPRSRDLIATLLRSTDPSFCESNTSEPMKESFFQPTAHDALASTGEIANDSSCPCNG